ncbi:MAG: hypothetical protein ACREMP_02315 [Candidatus Tyrphobacter sp.]
MFDVIDSLQPAFARAQRELRAAQRAVAHAEAGGRRGSDSAMAALASGATFDEALLAVTHSRLQEIATAAKA